MTIRKCVVGIGLMCLLLAAVARSQENAQLTGIITDPNAAVIPGASVSLIFPATGEVRHTAADNAGIYTFSNLRVGVYTLTVSASGFQTYSKTNRHQRCLNRKRGCSADCRQQHPDCNCSGGRPPAAV